ncbi:MmgE/PrpD family protein [Sagittula salina]|uniref:MmgE/PrpD family protein n=1 Tax=Sagittula salina TaxID=2820268 RepID=A0A940S087_9RHOB|nr:MmgE/PrpD family protein [Sagittula salina]MBP0481896.1 MmgE/PrpD family protein [Sagittula salina]
MSTIASILRASEAALSSVEARQVMRLSTVDWLACGIAGRDEPVAQAVRTMVTEEGGTPQATLFGGGRVPARAAALVNGSASHALDYDDTHFAHIGHPSVAVLSAAFAMGERVGASLEAVVDAGLMGCEASVRFGLLFGRAHYQVGFHQTATAGAFGATVAAGRLAGLDGAAMTHALATVSTRASGLKSQFGTMGKPFNAGIAAANGVEAALLAAQGFTSNPQALEGVNGFLATHHTDGAAEQSDRPLMVSVSHKFHACCHGLHATLEALATLPRPTDVAAITIATHPRWLTVCNIPAPASGLQLKFSYRAIAAAALLGHDTAALTTYTDALCADPALIALRERVTVIADPALQETEALVTLDTPEGTLEAHHDLDAALPLDHREARVRAKVTALLGERADILWQAITTNAMQDILRLM